MKLILFVALGTEDNRPENLPSGNNDGKVIRGKS